MTWLIRTACLNENLPVALKMAIFFNAVLKPYFMHEPERTWARIYSNYSFISIDLVFNYRLLCPVNYCSMTAIRVLTFKDLRPLHLLAKFHKK